MPNGHSRRQIGAGMRMGSLPPLVDIPVYQPRGGGVGQAGAGLMRMMQERQAQQQKQQQQSDAMFLNIAQSPGVGEEDLESIAGTLNPTEPKRKLGFAIRNINQNREKQLREAEKQEKGRTERLGMIKETLAPAHAAMVRSGVPAQEAVAASGANLAGIGGNLEELEMLRSLGYAVAGIGEHEESQRRREAEEASARGYRRGGTEHERNLRALDTGVDALGRPLTDWMRKRLEVRVQQEEQGGNQGGVFIRGPGNEIIATGPGIPHAMRERYENQFIDLSMYTGDLRDAIRLIRDDTSRGGAVGTAKRGVQSIAGILRDFASPETHEAIAGLGFNTYQQIEEDVAAGGTEADVLTWAQGIMDDPGVGQLQFLSLAIVYGTARQFKRTGRLNKDDVERAERSVGLTGGTNAARVVTRLETALKRAEKRLEVTQKQMRNIGMVTITPGDIPTGELSKAEQEADAYMREHGIGPYRGAPGAQP